MNMGKKTKRLCCRRKAVPLHFRKKNRGSLSQMLTTGVQMSASASYQRRIRELLKNNKALAIALQDSQCTISSNIGLLRNYERDINQILLAKMKVKDMAVTIQKLVGDLNDVLTHLDMCSLSVRRPFCDDARLRIMQPDLDTIDESVRSSVGENSDVANANTIDCSEYQVKSIPLNTSADSIIGNSSVTEIYDVHQIISKNFNSEALDSQPAVDVTTLEIKTPPTPQLNFSCLNVSKLALKETSQFLSNFNLDSENNTKLPTLKNTTIPISKIPIRMQNLQLEKPNFLGSSPVLDTEKRRETFVVTKINDAHQNPPMSANDKRGTFTLNEIHDTQTVIKDSNANRRETFVVPSLPLHFNSTKPDTKLLQTSTSHPSQVCNDDKTVLLSEDMDLTEIVPSFITNVQLNKDTNTPPFNAYVSSIKNDKQNMSDISKVTTKAYEPISPISKAKITPPNVNKDKSEDAIKENNPKLVRSEIPAKIIDPFENCHVLSTQTVQSSTRKSISPDMSCVPHRSSRRKSLHPVILEPKDVSPKNSEIQNSSSNNADSSKILENIDVNIHCTETLEKTETENEMDNTPSKPTSPSKSDTGSDSFASDPVSSDPDFVAEMPISLPPVRIPRRRKSIRPNLRGPYIFKSIKPSASDECKITSSQSRDTEIKSYDFSSSESEEETIKKSTVIKKKLKKDTKTSKSKKEDSSVAMLERDINLMYQDQSRKKRSMKRKVSFANINTSPINSDSEQHNYNENVEVKLALDIDTNLNSVKHSTATGDGHENELKRRSILKNRLSIMPSNNPQSSCKDKNISPSKDNEKMKNVEFEVLKKKVKSGDHIKKLSKKSTKNLDELVTLGNDLSSENKSETDLKQRPLKSNKIKSVNKKYSDLKCHEINEKISLPSNLVSDKLNMNTETTDLCELGELTHKTNAVSKTPELRELNNTPCEGMKDSTKKVLQEIENSDSSFDIGRIKDSEKLGEVKTKGKTLSFERKEASSDIFTFKNKNSKGSKSKRTFSGVSERSSKKRITADDILEEIEVNNPSKSVASELVNNIVSEIKITENEKTPKDIKSKKKCVDANHFDSELAENYLPKTENAENLKPIRDTGNDKSNAKPVPELDNLYKSNDQELPSNTLSSKGKRGKSKPKSNSLTKHKKQSVNLEKNEDEQQFGRAFAKVIASPRSSKTRKTNSIDRTTSEKENFPDLESGGRSRRSRAQICFKEPSLNKKLRR